MPDAHDSAWSALLAEPKPITKDRALSIIMSTSVALGKDPQEIQGWFDTNADALINKLNSN